MIPINTSLRNMAALFGIGILLGACASSRFQTISPASAARQAPPIAEIEEPVAALPSSPVTSSPLPNLSSVGPVIADVPAVPQPDLSKPPVVAAITQPPSAPPNPSLAPTRSTLTGGWTAKDATGTNCRVVLSSAPALDLYRANSANCANRDLQRITAWDFRDSEVYLYQQGGGVVARLRVAGTIANTSMDGALSKSGAPLSLSR